MSTETPANPSEAASAGASRSQALLVMPGTGEVLDLKQAPTTELAEWRMRTIEAKRQLNSVGSDLDQELAARIDFESAARTVRVGGFEIVVDAPTSSEWDLERLDTELAGLVDDGRIAAPVAEAAIRVTVSRAPAVAHLKKLLGHADPEVRESIARCRTTVENTNRRVAVRLATK